MWKSKKNVNAECIKNIYFHITSLDQQILNKVFIFVLLTEVQTCCGCWSSDVVNTEHEAGLPAESIKYSWTEPWSDQRSVVLLSPLHWVPPRADPLPDDPVLMGITSGLLVSLSWSSTFSRRAARLPDGAALPDSGRGARLSCLPLVDKLSECQRRIRTGPNAAANSILNLLKFTSFFWFSSF